VTDSLFAVLSFTSSASHTVTFSKAKFTIVVYATLSLQVSVKVKKHNFGPFLTAPPE